MKHLFSLVLLSLFTAVTLVSAQVKDSTKAEKTGTQSEDEQWIEKANDWWGEDKVHDTTATVVKDDWWNDAESVKNGFKHKIKVSIPKISLSKQMPFIELEYGVNTIKNMDMFQDFSKNGYAGLKVGRAHNKALSKDSLITTIDRSYLFLAFYNQDIRKANDPFKLTANVLHFGYNWDDGYGYRFRNQGLQFTNNYGFGWSRIKPAGTVVLLNDANILNYYGTAFRFSTRTEANAKIKLFPGAAVEGAVERMTVYPRMLFWRIGASHLCEVVAQSLLDEFIDEVASSSPRLVPIVNFLLKSGMAYGISQLRAEAMHFPFGGDAPIMLDTYKIGVCIGF